MSIRHLPPRRATAARRCAGVIGFLSVVMLPVLGLSQTAQAVAPSAPSAPTAVSAVAGNQSADVTWTVGDDGGDPITNFVITPYIGATEQTPVTVTAGATGSALDPTPTAVDNSTVSGLIGGSTYTFVVAAMNAIGTGAASTASTAVTVLSPPTTPSLQVLNGITTIAFPDSILVGDISDDYRVEFINNGTGNDAVTNYLFGGVDPDDFVVDNTTCQSVSPGQLCIVDVAFIPGALGPRSATLTLVDGGTTPAALTLTGTGSEGYYEATATGAVYGYGDAPLYGDHAGTALTKPIVSVQSTGDDGGYFMVASDGGIFTYGDATYFGSTGAIHLNKPIVGMALTPDDGGYWLVASDGGIFAFGDAPFYGSTGALRLNKPIVGMAVTPDGDGYWLVASDGGIFTFGDASFYGSTGELRLNKPIVGMAPTPDGGGYWLVASDGGIFTFGDASFDGSTGALHLVKPIIGMAATPDGGGYWLTAADGGLFTFGDAPFDGSAGGHGITNMVSVAGSGPPTLQAILDVPAFRPAKLEGERPRHRNSPRGVAQ